MNNMKATSVGVSIAPREDFERLLLAAIIDDDMDPVLIGLPEDRFHGAANELGAILGTGNDGNGGRW